MARHNINPFKPGSGRSPALLAGRSYEQEVLKRVMAEIVTPRVARRGRLRGEPPQHLKIVGPRGVGKTALLTWMQGEEKPKKIMAVRWAYVQGKTSGNTFDTLLDELAGPPDSEVRLHIEAGVPGLKAGAERRPGQPQQIGFRQIMAERLKRNPVLLLLDEVMHYDKDLLSQVLQESQRLSSEGWPLALILAGTPALDIHLRGVDATFTKRSKNLFINVLSDEAVREALKGPFEQRGIKVTDDALELMASLTSNYPFFTQIVGEVVWDVQEERKEIDVPLVEKAKPAIQSERHGFYGGVYEDIRNDGLLLHASQIVAMMDEAAEAEFALAPEHLVDKLAASNNMEEKPANDILRHLLDHGLVWFKGDRRVERGIPSFFTYFKAEYKRSKLLASDSFPAK